ncbi:glycosyltransferase family 4 protein [Cellulophaga sp. HaHaR_3_176]|uniref:glycosyltransferase family 4 protein n=1 Tax=Cellulophaga sp. HaHaR_3_176 TaxID=1942464 RepID=UPI001C1FBCF3|nr:glycosyltransferase family 1 protein [Cellulophaga sp. HaHaR_3_176]QWX83329.1 glycosyltransferase family 4 protein [Cellulophaga sp. HaHaR_3_176]
MNVKFLIHQKNSLGYSMARYIKFISNGMLIRGHNIEVWGPKLYLSGGKIPNPIKKWLRYIDQYILFPIWFKWQSKKYDKDNLYVLIDQALGIWTPLIKKKKHIIHCHDFIALKSSQGLLKENTTSWTGKIYQNLILSGFSKAENFISISKNTQKELTQFLTKKPAINAQIYNAIDAQFKPEPIDGARLYISKYIKSDISKGYILHVGGNTFYKNRNGVLQIYSAWRKQSTQKLPLIMVGSAPTASMVTLKENSPYGNDIYFLTRVTDTTLINAYQGASVFLFPSLLEGFGFPIAEAMACGCPVITTNEAPMNEVGGEAAFYIPKYTSTTSEEWEIEASKVVEKIVSFNSETRNTAIKLGLEQSKKFQEDLILDQIEEIYQKIK